MKYPIFKGKFHFYEPEKNRTIASCKAEESELLPAMVRVSEMPVRSGAKPYGSSVLNPGAVSIKFGGGMLAIPPLE